MDFNKLFSSLTIIKQSIKFLTINTKPLFLITTLSLLASSVFFSFFDFSALSIMRDMLAKESLLPISSASSSEFSNKFLFKTKGNTFHLLEIYFTFVFSYLIINLFVIVATTVVSFESYKGKTLSLHELFALIARSWTRPLVTGFYTTIFVIGYIYFVLHLSEPLLSKFSGWSSLGALFLFGGLAYIVHMYFSVIWILGLVVSIIDGDQICGVEALGKGAKTAKGYRMIGISVNVVINLISLGVYFGANMFKGGKFGLTEEKISGLFLVNCSILLKILTFMIYTAMYLTGIKSDDNNEIELNLNNASKYKKLVNNED